MVFVPPVASVTSRLASLRVVLFLLQDLQLEYGLSIMDDGFRTLTSRSLPASYPDHVPEALRWMERYEH